MNKIKLALGAFLLTFLQLAHSAEKKEIHFNDIPRGVKAMIFNEASRHTKPGDLRLVCKDWQKTIDLILKSKVEKEKPYKEKKLLSQKWLQEQYGVFGCDQFLNGKLVYKPNNDNNNGMIELKISDLKNPFSCQFDLSKCGRAGNDIAIMTGFRTQKLEENEDKVEVWLAPRASIEKFRHSTAKHFEEILTTWNGEKAPFGLFYTWGNWDNLSWYEYLTDKTIDVISNKNLYENWDTANIHTHNLSPFTKMSLSLISCFVFELK